MKMKFSNRIFSIRNASATIALALLCIVSLNSYRVIAWNDDFLKQLGLEKADADKKINYSLLSGYFDAGGLSKAKSMALNDRAAMTKDLLVYIKKYVNTDDFKKEYEAMRQSRKPEAVAKPDTPEEMRKKLIATGKEYVTNAENNVKTATPDTKKMFEDALKSAQEFLKEAEDPDNAYMKAYALGYPDILVKAQEANDQNLTKWEAEYPAQSIFFVKKRLSEFLAETKDVDFDAALKDQYGKKVFVNATYERKSKNWKMAYRAGRQVIAPARTFAQEWLKETGSF